MNNYGEHSVNYSYSIHEQISKDILRTVYRNRWICVTVEKLIFQYIIREMSDVYEKNLNNLHFIVIFYCSYIALHTR